MDLTCVIVLLLLCGTAARMHVLLLTDLHGAIHSPNFPESYPKDTDMQWNISVPDGYRIRLYFMHFDVEPSYLCEYDYVRVYSETEELAVFCGRESTDTERVPADDIIVSLASLLSVAFRSDFSNEERYSGFEAHYSAVDIDECKEGNDEDLACDHFCHNFIGGYYCSCRYGYQLHSDNRSCKVECSDSVFTQQSGLISSPDFPKPYPKSSDCMYHIELENGLHVTLEFEETFDIEDHPEVSCPYDHIKIQAGEKELGPFCGDRSPGRIQTGSNVVRILFHTDNSGENLGWRLTYTSTGSECPVPVLPPNSHLEPLQSQYFFKDYVTVTCDPGYSLQKDEEHFEHYQIECQTDGTWSSSIPLCKMADCGPVDETLGDVVYNSSGNSTTVRSKILFRCKSFAGEHSAYACNQSGVWVGEDGAVLPACQSGKPLTISFLQWDKYYCPTYKHSLAQQAAFFTCVQHLQSTTQRKLESQLPISTSNIQSVCGKASRPFPLQQKRIVGGRSAPPGLFPWQVLLSVEDVLRVPEGRWFGSGALLSASWVLTAAHVLLSPRREPSIVPVAPEHVRATLGLMDVRDKQLAINRLVEKLVLHSHFDPRNYDNDIALVKLSQEVVPSEMVRPVCLPPPWVRGQPPAPQTNTLGVVAGWGINMANASAGGLTSDPGVVSEVLQYVKLPVVAQDECEASYASRSPNYNITANMFCAGFYEGGHDTCLGDSGGAFVSEDTHRRWVVQGLVSWGGPEECGSRRVYGVYTRVANYARWLQAQMDVERWW